MRALIARRKSICHVSYSVYRRMLPGEARSFLSFSFGACSPFGFLDASACAHNGLKVSLCIMRTEQSE